MDRLKIALLVKGSHNWIGGNEYFENLILALASLPSFNQLFELCVISDEHLPPHILPFVTKVYTRKDMLPVGFIERIKWKLIRYFSSDQNSFFESFLKKEKIKLLYPYYNPDKRQKPYSTAAWIPDFQHKYFPEYFTSTELKFRDESFSELTKCAEKVILSSKMAEADCHRFYVDSIDKTAVMPFCTVPQPEWYEIDSSLVLKKYNLPNKFFLVSNQFWQHKNHCLIFDALQILKQQSIFPMIVCTGSLYDYRCPEYTDTVLGSIHELNISKQLLILGLISKLDQIQLMRRSIAIIQPSLFEGWSTVVENAKCFDKPLILSDFPVHLEQKPANSIYFERNSAEQLAKCIASYWDTKSIGPDLESEKHAFIRQQEHVINFGESFLKLNNLF